MNPTVAHEPAPATLTCSPETPVKHCLRQSPIDESLCGSTSFQQRSTSTSGAKKVSLHELERVRITICLNLHHPSLKAKRDLLDSWFLPRGKMSVCEWAPISPSVQDAATQANFSLTPSRLLNHELHDWQWKGRGENLEDCQIGFSEDIKGNESYKLQHRLYQEAHPPAVGDALPLDFPQLVHGHPQHSTCLIHTHPHSVAGSLWVLLTAVASELWQMVSEYMLKVGLHLWARERPQTWTLARPLRKWKGGCQHSAWSFAVSIACIQA